MLHFVPVPSVLFCADQSEVNPDWSAWNMTIRRFVQSTSPGLYEGSKSVAFYQVPRPEFFFHVLNDPPLSSPFFSFPDASIRSTCHVESKQTNREKRSLIFYPRLH